MRSYAEAIAAWFDSGCQDFSHLLRGQDLQNALAWADGKSLSDRDYQFLFASQKLELAEAQGQLQEAQSHLNQAKRNLRTARKATRVAQLATRLEQDGTNALRQFFESSQIDGLLSAMQAGFALKRLVKNERSLAKYPAYAFTVLLKAQLNQWSTCRQGKRWDSRFIPYQPVECAKPDKRLGRAEFGRSARGLHSNACIAYSHFRKFHLISNPSRQ